MLFLAVPLFFHSMLPNSSVPLVDKGITRSRTLAVLEQWAGLGRAPEKLDMDRQAASALRALRINVTQTYRCPLNLISN